MERLATRSPGRRDRVERQPKRGDGLRNLQFRGYLRGGQRRDRISSASIRYIEGPPGNILAGLFLRGSALLAYFFLTGRTDERRPLRKDLTREAKNIGVCFAPRIGRQLGLAAGFRQELLGAEMVLDRDLGEQQPALAASRNKQAMTANFDLFGANGNWRGKERYFDAQLA